MLAAFYMGNRSTFNKITAWWTNGRRSHVELVFSDGMWATSDHTKNGVTIRNMTNYKPSHWEFVRIDETLFSEEYARELVEQNLGKGYDWAGILGFALGPINENPKRMFCSELVMAALGYTMPWRFNPEDVYHILKRLEPEPAKGIFEVTNEQILFRRSKG